MRMVLGTNIWSHHQGPLASALANLLTPGEFKMVVFEAVHAERAAMGWDASGTRPPWLLGPPITDAERREILEVCRDADVMILGDCPVDVCEARIGTGKLTFVAAERHLKKRYHSLRLLNPRYALGIDRYRERVNHPNVHGLAIGRHAAGDWRRISAFGRRIWRWGYFVEVPSTAPSARPDAPVEVLWAGRMLGWKRVDLLLRALAPLRESTHFGSCALVGDGPERQRLERLASRLGFEEGRVRFIPSVPHGEVRRLMRTSDIYVMPSDGYEGWGAVVGEAMSEGCVAVGCEAAGSSQELIVDGESGRTFAGGDVRQLTGILTELAEDRATRSRIRQRAWERMTTLWSPEVAARRILALARALRDGKPSPFTEGPCSPAAPMDGLRGEAQP